MFFYFCARDNHKSSRPLLETYFSKKHEVAAGVFTLPGMKLRSHWFILKRHHLSREVPAPLFWRATLKPIQRTWIYFPIFSKCTLCRLVINTPHLTHKNRGGWWPSGFEYQDCQWLTHCSPGTGRCFSG